jgi:hypothetical protein
MFDHDAPPVTPQVVLIGNRASAAVYAIRDFLTRNGHPYEWVDVDECRDAGGDSVYVAQVAGGVCTYSWTAAT